MGKKNPYHMGMGCQGESISGRNTIELHTNCTISDLFEVRNALKSLGSHYWGDHLLTHGTRGKFGATIFRNNRKESSIKMSTRRYSLPKRFNVALSDKAYKILRALNEKYGYGNNYLLTILLENFEGITSHKEVEKVFDKFKAEYGAPAVDTRRKNR